jgi:hypothetical protein
MFKKWDGVGSMDSIDLAQDRDTWLALVNMVMNLWVPYNAGNFLSTGGSVGFSGGTLLHEISLLVCSFNIF